MLPIKHTHFFSFKSLIFCFTFTATVEAQVKGSSVFLPFVARSASNSVTRNSERNRKLSLRLLKTRIPKSGSVNSDLLANRVKASTSAPIAKRWYKSLPTPNYNNTKKKSLSS
uniref:Putative secreted protein n=1 Tax=Ixodes ricinus TaxID=34613 RepID=A0A6B0UKG1_IXORI